MSDSDNQDKAKNSYIPTIPYYKLKEKSDTNLQNAEALQADTLKQVEAELSKGNLKQAKAIYCKHLVSNGYNYIQITSHFCARFPNAKATELENEIFPLVRQMFLKENSLLESRRDVERMKAIERLTKQAVQLEALITFEIENYKKLVAEYSDLFHKSQKQISNANLARVLQCYIEIQDKINKILGLEEISINLIKTQIQKIPNMTDAELYSDLKKILSLRGMLPESASSVTIELERGSEEASE